MVNKTASWVVREYKLVMVGGGGKRKKNAIEKNVKHGQ